MFVTDRGMCPGVGGQAVHRRARLLGLSRTTERQYGTVLEAAGLLRGSADELPALETWGMGSAPALSTSADRSAFLIWSAVAVRGAQALAWFCGESPRLIAM